jgi:hypothetical protein
MYLDVMTLMIKKAEITLLTYKGRCKAPHRRHLVLLEVKIDETIALGKPSVSRENATAGYFLNRHTYSDETHERQRTSGDIVKIGRCLYM